jgi:predicted permease
LLRALPPLRDFTTSRFTLTLQLPVNWRVFVFSLVLSAVTVLMFGLLPAFVASRISLDSVLRSIRSTGRWRGRNILVAVQIALCTMLISSAGLLNRTFYKLHRTDPGFDVDRTVTFTATTSILGYTSEQTATLRERLVDRVYSIPGVSDVATARMAVMRSSGQKATIAPAGRSFTPNDILNVSANAVSPDYFRTMSMPLLAGRSLTNRDSDSTKPQPVVVNLAFARRFFPDSDPLGKLLGLPKSGTAMSPQGVADGTYQIVGVVTDAKYRSLREPIGPTIYSPFGHSLGGTTFQLLVRTKGRPESLIQPVRQALAELDPMLPFTEIHTLSEEVGSSIALERLTAALASVFASIAAVLVGVGIYSLLTYIAIQKQREISIRMALGAQPTHIGRMFSKQMLLLLMPGVLFGLVSAVVAGRWIQSLLYGIEPMDPVSFVTAAVFVLLLSTIATMGPVIRALSTQPATALREEI